MALGALVVCGLAAAAWGIERSRRVAAESEAERAAAQATLVETQLQATHTSLMKAKARALAAEAGRSPDPQRAILLARAAVLTDVTPATLGALRAALLACLERATIRGGDGPVRAASWSPDGTKVVAGWEDGTVVVAAADGARAGRTKCAGEALEDVAWSPDGKRLVCALDDGTARLLDAASPDLREIAALRGHAAPVYAARWSPDGTLVATASSDGTARIWTADGKERAVLRGHEGGVTAALFSPDGRRLLTISRDATARIWSVADGTEVAVLRGHTDTVLCATWTPDGAGIVTGSKDGTARMWDAAGAPGAVLRGPDDAILAVAVAPAGDRVAIAGKDGTVVVFDAKGDEPRTFRAHMTAATSVSFTADGRRVLTSSWDATARLWTLEGTLLASFRGHPGWIDRAAFSPDGRRLLTGARDASARIWDVEASEVAVLDKTEDTLRALVWSRRGPGATNGRDELIDPRRVAGAGGVPADDPVVETAYLGAERFVFVTRRGVAYVVAAAERKPAEIRVPDARIVAVAASPGGRTIATGDSAGGLRLWDVSGAPPTETRSFPPRTGSVAAVAFEPQRGLLLSAGDDGRVLVHDLADGRLVDAIEASMSRLTALDVSPQGDRVATAAAGEPPRVWALGAEALLAAAAPRILRDWTPEEIEAFAEILPPIERGPGPAAASGTALPVPAAPGR
jgi:WD40 repeat protein